MTHHQDTNDMALIGKIVVVVPRFTQWTGTRAMHEGDYTIGTGGQLPPKEVTKSLGLKAIIDTQELRVFDRIKHKAEVLLEGCGVKYLSGWAIPQDKADEVFKALDALVEQYSMEKADFLSRYDALVKDWADKNPSFSKEIMEGKLDVNVVSERISAGYETFRLQPVSEDPCQPQDGKCGAQNPSEAAGLGFSKLQHPAGDRLHRQGALRDAL